MKVVIIGGTGLIGRSVAASLRQIGHEVLTASPSSGVNSVTGEGLDAALQGADVLIDSSNSPSFDDEAVMNFFRSSTGNLIASARLANIRHYIAVSVVGTDRLLESGYFRAKDVQEGLIKQSGVPFTIVRATQFFEFVGAIAYTATDGNSVRLSSAGIQPISAADVSKAIANIALERPRHSIVEIAGPEVFKLTDLVQLHLEKTGDYREVVTDNTARYFGATLHDDTLLPGSGALIAGTRFEEWLNEQQVKFTGAA